MNIVKLFLIGTISVLAVMMMTTTSIGVAPSKPIADPDPYCNNMNITQSYCSTICQSNGRNCPTETDHVTTQFYSQSVNLTHWQNTVSIPVSDLPCASASGYTTPQSTIALGWNFTESLSGRDPGSTWVQFRGIAETGLFLLRQQDVTSSLVGELFCTGPEFFDAHIFSEAQAVLPTIGYPLTTSYRVSGSGTFVLLALSYSNTVPPSIGPYVANETWTVTTLS